MALLYTVGVRTRTSTTRHRRACRACCSARRSRSSGRRAASAARPASTRAWCSTSRACVGLYLLWWSFRGTHDYDAIVFRGGFLIVDVATLLVICAVVHPRSRHEPVLGIPLLVWIGLRSYGIYLWHFPIFASPGRRPRRHVRVHATRLAVVRDSARPHAGRGGVVVQVRRGADPVRGDPPVHGAAPGRSRAGPASAHDAAGSRWRRSLAARDRPRHRPRERGTGQGEYPRHHRPGGRGEAGSGRAPMEALRELQRTLSSSTTTTPPTTVAPASATTTPRRPRRRSHKVCSESATR